MIQKAKSDYYKKAFLNCKSKPVKMWTLINNLSYNKVRESEGPTQLRILNDTVTDKKSICECFNNFFSTIGSSLASKIITSQHNKTYTNIKQSAHPGSTEFFKLMPVTTEAVSNIINNLDQNTSN